jgi:hypothetical protein
MRHARGGRLEQMADGHPLRSGADEYVIVARPGTAGFLYLFQIDARGAVSWYFPGNEEPLSDGHNPVAPGQWVFTPSDRTEGLYLDAHVGKEHVYAVLSSARWPALEEFLADARRSRQAVSPGGGTRGAKGKRPLDPPADLQWRNTPLRVLGEEVEADGSFLIVERWFVHQ